jgi:hypothetical protein
MQYLSAASLLVGGMLATAGLTWLGIADPEREGLASGRYAMNGLVMAGGALLAFGLPSIHAAQADQAGWVGAAAILVLFIGMVVAYLAVHGIETVNAGLPRNAIPLTYLAVPCLFVGNLVTAIVSWRADVVPTALPSMLVVAILTGTLTLVRSIPPRVNTLVPVVYTVTLTAWGFVLLRDLMSA